MTNERSVWENGILVVMLLGLMTGASMAQAADVTPLMSKELTESPGKEVLMITVEKAPGGQTRSTDTMHMDSSTCWRDPL